MRHTINLNLPEDLDGDELVVLPWAQCNIPGAQSDDGIVAVALIDLARHIVAEYDAEEDDTDADVVRPSASVTTDQRAVDKIASILGAPEWEGADFCEWIADIIGEVRPHPGNYATRDEYADIFAEEIGRDVIRRED